MKARLTLALLAFLGAIVVAQAQSPPAPACTADSDPLGCEHAQLNLSPRMLNLLSTYQDGGPALEEAAYRMAVAQPEQAFDLVALANRANPEQMAAIARGLLHAFDELAESRPECRAGCMDRLQQVAMLRKLRPKAQTDAQRQKCVREGEPLPKAYPLTCGMPVRAAMQCANQTLASLLAALARQLYTTVDTASGSPRGCFAPVYQSPHNAAGWTSSTPPADLPISRN